MDHVLLNQLRPAFGPHLQRSQGGEQILPRPGQAIPSLRRTLDQLRFLKITQSLAQDTRRHVITSPLQSAKAELFSSKFPQDA